MLRSFGWLIDIFLFFYFEQFMASAIWTSYNSWRVYFCYWMTKWMNLYSFFVSSVHFTICLRGWWGSSEVLGKVCIFWWLVAWEISVLLCMLQFFHPSHECFHHALLLLNGTWWFCRCVYKCVCWTAQWSLLRWGILDFANNHLELPSASSFTSFQ